MINSYKYLSILVSILSVFLIIACGGSSVEPVSASGDPSDLSIEINVSDDESGMVSVAAEATNAILYEFDMGLSTNGTGSSVDGRFDFVYESSGVFTVEVKAYGSSGRFIKTEKQLTIISGDPSTSGEGYTTPITYDDWNLLWNDEFDGSILDQSIWSYQNGDGCPDLCGWGNNELEYYRPENSKVDKGLLIIEARKEPFQNSQYTSTKMLTQDKKVFTYGRIDVRAKLPTGKGLWPAIWMLGSNITSVSWPECGEIDIMEMVGGNGGEKVTHGTAHWQNLDNQHASNGNSKTATKGLDEEFHVFSIIWSETEIEWLIDDISYHTLDIRGDEMEAFHKPFYMILNVAVGGNWPGNPTADTVFPTQMQVDYVRVFQKK